METIHHHNPHRNRSSSPQAATPDQPDWIRLPRSGEKCPYSNLSRSTLNNLILPSKANKNCPPVKSSVVRQKGATRGVRLIHRRSLMEYIEAGQEPAFDQDAKVSPRGLLHSLKERRLAIARVQTFSIGGNQKTRIPEPYLFPDASPKTFDPPKSTRPPAPGGSVLN